MVEYNSVAIHVRHRYQILPACISRSDFSSLDVGYNEARQIWNASVDKRPRVMARCSGVADVTAAVNVGRANNLLTAIRAGGHNVGGPCAM
jgi:hypothetical protein